MLESARRVEQQSGATIWSCGFGLAFTMLNIKIILQNNAEGD